MRRADIVGDGRNFFDGSWRRYVYNDNAGKVSTTATTEAHVASVADILHLQSRTAQKSRGDQMAANPLI
mgnify:CR=1